MKLHLSLFAILLCLSSLSCGVKGKPMPPLTAPPIGRGQPTMAQPEDDPTPTPTPENKTVPGTGR